MFATESGSRPPNIVLIIADDHGPEARGCHGNSAIRPPDLDAHGADGVRVANARCATASRAARRSAILTRREIGNCHPPAVVRTKHHEVM